MSAPASTPPAVKFLLVDDREENLVALDALVRRDGLETLLARSADEALELLLAHDVALALLDVEMPGMDGFALAELMRGSVRTRHVPIIFVTANPLEQQRMFDGYDAGAVDFLIKPIEPRVLRHKTETFFELYRKRQAVAEMLRLNEMFVAAVGHDLRNPLNVVMFSSELLLRTSSDAGVRRAAERIRTSAQRMTHIVDDLFDLARARLGNGLLIHRKRVDVGAIVERIVAEYQVTHHGHTIKVSAKPCPEGEWDVNRIEQVVSNLVGNAIRHGDPEQPIVIDVGPRDDGICISVHNGGCIPADLLPRIFLPFVLRDRQSGQGGLGMGLYIVEQIVLAHRGHVEVRSTPYEGTTFAVQLPLHAETPRGNLALT